MIFAIGTLASWAGWIALLRGLFVLFRAVFGPAEADHFSGWRSAAICAGISAAGFLLSSQLLPGTKEGWRLPLVWVVMPFTAWAASVGIAMALGRAVQVLLALNRDEKAARSKSSIIWMAAGLFFSWAFISSGDKVEILRGGIVFSSASALGFGLVLLATLATMVFTAKSLRAKHIAVVTINHLALLAGCVVFGLPFAWLVITSFKEDQDMSSPNGLVWVPHVRERVPYFDPIEQRAEGTFEGQKVEGAIQEKRPDGSAKIEIDKPAVLRGLSFVEPKPTIVPKLIDVVTGTYEGQKVKGKVIRELEDGSKRVEVTSPPTLIGKTYVAKADEVELVRPIGLNYLNYPEALDYLPPETLRGLVYIKNTLVIVILSVLGTILSSSIVAYAFARLRFPGKNALFFVLLSTMMLPAAVTLIPTFLIFRWLGWIDTLRPLWVPAFLGSAFNIFLLRQFFLTIPAELEDAAKIDGCSYPRTFWQVMLPQIKPALAVVAIWTFLGAWNNFMGPLIYINSPENMPISYAVQLFQGDRTNEPGLLMAFATMAMLPVLAVFFFAQKYFIEGVTLSGLGGR